MQRYPLHFVTRLLTGLLILACVVLPLRSLAVPIVTAGSATVNVGDIFVVPVSISGVDPGEPISSWQFDLTFDNTSVIRVHSPPTLQSAEVTEGDFLTNALQLGETTLFQVGFFDNTSGLIAGVSDSIIGVSTADAPGSLALIEFEALAPGVSDLLLSSVFLNLGLTGFEGENGLVTVIGAQPIPEPSTVFLVAIVLGILTLRRVVRPR
jgi:hypothetical protein